MKKIIKITSIITICLFAAACLQNPMPPAESSTPQLPVPEAITAGNAERLTTIFTASMGSGPVSATWSADGTAVWIEDGLSATLFDSATGEVRAQFNPGENSVIYDVSPDGKNAIYSQDGLVIHLYDVTTQDEVLSITPDFPFASVFFNNDGSLLGATSLNDIEVVVWDTASGAEKKRLRGFETAAPVYNAAFGADGDTLLWVSRGTVQVMDIASQKMGPVFFHEDFVSAQDLSPDGKTAATTAAATINSELQPTLTFWDAESGEILRQITQPEYFTSIAFSPDSKLLAAGTQKTVLLFSVPHGDEVYRLDTSEMVVSLAFSPDGSKLITCGDAGTIWVYTAK